MKEFLSLLICCVFALSSASQLVIKEKKYPSLLWEISGNGMKKPSYLIGTMHVSNKLAFNLPDSFYIAVKNAQVVALETNPETWQEDMDKYQINTYGYGNSYGEYNIPSDYLVESTLKFYKYYSKIEKALYSNSSAINSLLYRSYGNGSSDFEEDTYLDMYIFQCGKKLGKKVTGVENYGESMKLMAEAYQDATKDKNKKQRAYADGAEDYSMDKLQEAYRTGNLDLLDTINKFNSTSAAFDEKFLYRRNDIQANSIDSILKSGSTLFVGVGAAHLPGHRGVIEILRRNGYKLRPVKMGERNSREKDIVDKIKVPVTFKTTSADDGMYKVDIPGKFYKTGDDPSLIQWQYADMANGSYYMVTRIYTNGWMWNHNEEKIYAAIDSLLYENVPGKIVSRTAIIKNGYKGFDITNRTRRGDLQRSNIFVTPFEILFFKISGTGDYVKIGKEASNFFNSIQLKEFIKKNTDASNSWTNYTPSTGGFSVKFPHAPAISNDGSWIYDAVDKTSSTQYRIIRTDVHNYNFVEEDTFDLGLIDESFRASEFIDSLIYRKQTIYKGYPALDAKYKDKDGGIFVARFIIQGPHYYTVMAHGRSEIGAMNNFINSFEIKPYSYENPSVKTDTVLKFTVTTPVYPAEKKIKLDMPTYSMYDDEDGGFGDMLNGAEFKSKTITCDSTGEQIFVTYYRWSPYFYTKDTTIFDDEKNVNIKGDSTWIVRLRKSMVTDNGMKVRETIISDTGSSRMLWGKSYMKEGLYYTLTTAYDTLTTPSNFIKTFYDTFHPADTVKGVSPFVRKTNLFFQNLNSLDSTTRKKALAQISSIDIDSSDFKQLVSAINNLGWKQKNYLKVKGDLLSRFSEIRTKDGADYLKAMYYAVGDTVQLQYGILENLLQQKTAYAFSLFKDIINNEPPVLVDESYDGRPDYLSSGRGTRGGGNDNDNFFDELNDSLHLTQTILPALLPLLNLQDYKNDMMGLLSNMIDSNLIKSTDYEIYFTKFLIEAKQELRKQAIAEKKKLIQAAEDDKKDNKQENKYGRYEKADNGNADLGVYATLLLPFADKNVSVMPVIGQMLASNDKRLKYNTLHLLLNKNKPVSDTLIKYFASLDEYRYELFVDLICLNKANLFPILYRNHIDLARAKLYTAQLYTKPDSLVFLERTALTYKSKRGFVYFFKYKKNKEDLVWKLATVGIVPEEVNEIDFLEKDAIKKGYKQIYVVDNDYDFTDFSDEVLKDDKPLSTQISTVVKKIKYSKRLSGAKFYDEDEPENENYEY